MCLNLTNNNDNNTRFPPLSLVCMCDSNFTLSWRQTTTAILAQHKPGVTPPVVSDLQPAVDSQGVVCFLLDNSVVTTINIYYYCYYYKYYYFNCNVTTTKTTNMTKTTITITITVIITLL